MATQDEVRRALDKDELDYPGLARELGAGAQEHLRALVAEDDPRIASKAAYLSALIGGSGADAAVSLAAASRHVSVRVAAAAALDKLPADKATDVAKRLLADPDVGIRARAAKSAIKVDSPQVATLIRDLSKKDAHPDVRALAARLIKPA